MISTPTYLAGVSPLSAWCGFTKLLLNPLSFCYCWLVRLPAPLDFNPFSLSILLLLAWGLLTPHLAIWSTWKPKVLLMPSLYEALKRKSCGIVSESTYKVKSSWRYVSVEQESEILISSLFLFQHLLLFQGLRPTLYFRLVVSAFAIVYILIIFSNSSQIPPLIR